MNNKIAAMIAIPASVRPERISIFTRKLRVIQAKTANAKITKTFFSSFDTGPSSFKDDRK